MFRLNYKLLDVKARLQSYQETKQSHKLVSFRPQNHLKTRFFCVDTIDIKVPQFLSNRSRPNEAQVEGTWITRIFAKGSSLFVLTSLPQDKEKILNLCENLNSRPRDSVLRRFTIEPQRLLVYSAFMTRFNVHLPDFFLTVETIKQRKQDAVRVRHFMYHFTAGPHALGIPVLKPQVRHCKLVGELRQESMVCLSQNQHLPPRILEECL